MLPLEDKKRLDIVLKEITLLEKRGLRSSTLSHLTRNTDAACEWELGRLCRRLLLVMEWDKDVLVRVEECQRVIERFHKETRTGRLVSALLNKGYAIKFAEIDECIQHNYEIYVDW
jgi:hypothetical protein